MKNKAKRDALNILIHEYRKDKQPDKVIILQEMLIDVCIDGEHPTDIYSIDNLDNRILGNARGQIDLMLRRLDESIYMPKLRKYIDEQNNIIRKKVQQFVDKSSNPNHKNIIYSSSYYDMPLYNHDIDRSFFKKNGHIELSKKDDKFFEDEHIAYRLYDIYGEKESEKMLVGYAEYQRNNFHKYVDVTLNEEVNEMVLQSRINIENKKEELKAVKSIDKFLNDNKQLFNIKALILLTNRKLREIQNN